MNTKSFNTGKTKTTLRKFVLAAIALIFAFAAMAGLSGCMSAGQITGNEEQEITASDYMVKLNQASTSLKENLQAFTLAVAEDDVSALQPKATSAYEAMNVINDLQPPEELSDISKKYKDAIAKLEKALDEYIALYMDIKNLPKGENMDSSKYSKALEDIQKSYDSGINMLDEADKAATEL